MLSICVTGIPKCPLILKILEDRRRALPAADAHRHHAVTRIAPAHFAQQLHGKLCPGSPERVSERDGPAVRVRALVVYSEFAHHRYRLTSKRLVEFDQIDLVQREAGKL